jgi:hypothetical protein
VDRPAGGSIQNVPSGLLISQDFSPRSVPNRHLQGALRTKRFFRTSVPTDMLALADDAALARLVIAAAQHHARLPPSSFPIAAEGMPARPRTVSGRLISLGTDQAPPPLLHAPPPPPSPRPPARSPPRARIARILPRRLHRGRSCSRMASPSHRWSISCALDSRPRRPSASAVGVRRRSRESEDHGGWAAGAGKDGSHMNDAGLRRNNRCRARQLR